MSPDATRRFEDATATEERCRSLFLRINLKTFNLTHMKAHDLNRKDVASMNASVLRSMPAGFEQLRPADLASSLYRPTTGGEQEAKN